jgi:hypothetical protein
MEKEIETDRYTTENLTNFAKLNDFYAKQIKVHIILNRVLSSGKNVWLNGLLIEHPYENLYIIKEHTLGPVRVSIFEIKDVVEYKEKEK